MNNPEGKESLRRAENWRKDKQIKKMQKERIEALKEQPPGLQASDVRELGFALIRQRCNGAKGWIRRCYLKSVFKDFQKSRSYVRDEEPRFSDDNFDNLGSSSSSSSSSSDSY